MLIYQDLGHEEGDRIEANNLIGHMNYMEKFLEDTRRQERIDIMKSRILEGEDDANEGTNIPDPREQRRTRKTTSKKTVPSLIAGGEEEDTSLMGKAKHD